MAALELRGEQYRLVFRHGGKRHTFRIGKVTETEGRQWQARAEQLIMRLDQRLLTLPIGASIVDFIRFDGNPPTQQQRQVEAINTTTLHELREAYIATFSNGAIERNTIDTAKIHLTHLEKTFGRGAILSGFDLATLQKHVNRRQADVSPMTIKKEIDTFRAVWNWGQRMKLTMGVFPNAGLVYPKADQKLPFMSWEEITRHIKNGGDADLLWECLYLRSEQIAEFLVYAESVTYVPIWVYPMVFTAAHTGARRSELMRCRVEDADLENEAVTIREKKKSRSQRTTRRVPISKALSPVLARQIERQQGKTYLFGDGDTEISDPYAHKMFHKLINGSKWKVIKGWHTLRHSFISAMASKGVDQRIIDDCVGHCTEEQRRRYRHLFPAVTQQAIASVFG